MSGRSRWRTPAALVSAVTVALVASSYGVSFATHTPANKVVASGSKIAVISPQSEVTLLSATLRTSKPTDLILQLTMECSIFTQLVTGPSGNGGSDTATATGTVRSWIEIDGKVVPINDISSPPQNPANNGNGNKAEDAVTFCNRTYSRTVTDAENPQDGQDIERDFIDTKTANAFNWLRLNTGSGVHTIVVKADLITNTVGEASAQAVVGNRTLIVEPDKLANDAHV